MYTIMPCVLGLRGLLRPQAGKLWSQACPVSKLIEGFDSYTTPSQQLHNNPSHEGGPQCVGSTLM
jgi:hypothetical protein